MTDEELRAIEELVALGNSEAAKERLQNIVRPFPAEHQVEKLAGLYWRIGYAEMAGRLWYLTDSVSAEIDQAVAAFDHSCGDHPEIIQDVLWTSGAGYAARSARLRRLRERVEALPKPAVPPPTAARWLKERLIFLGCASVLFVVILLIILGGATIATWISRGMP